MEILYDFRVLLVKRVIDGDTAETIMDTGFGETTTRHLRLAHIDAPDRRHPQFGAARLYLEDWLRERHPYLRVHSYKIDSFGRWIADIYDYRTGDTASAALLSEGLAELWRGR